MQEKVCALQALIARRECATSCTRNYYTKLCTIYWSNNSITVHQQS